MVTKAASRIRDLAKSALHSDFRGYADRGCRRHLGLPFESTDTVDFSRDIRPIFNQNCASCHGGVRQKAGVSFLFRSEALGKGKSGRPTIVPSDPDASELIRRIVSTDPDMRMPHHAPPLFPEQIALLRRWIKQGAQWSDYWAFVPPKPQRLPAVKQAGWVRQPLDRFVLARLERESLLPSPEADKADLLRRVSLDLTGLPPSAEEQAAFLADQSPDAYDSTMRGGKHGPVIRPGDTKNSNLFHRITLSPSDDDFMPQGKKRPLSPTDVKIIEQWIATGASGTQLLSEVKDVPPVATPVAEVTFEEINPEAVSKERASVAPALSQFLERFPNSVDYQSRGSPDLVVSASWMGAKFGDDLLSALAPLAEHIVTADFSNTAVTDKSAVTIARMKRLRVLRLMHTKIGDATVNALGSLDQLESLSVFDTPVTSASLATLVCLPKLQHVYIGETKISVATPPPPAIKDKLVF